MYTIYVSHPVEHELNKILKKSNIYYNNNLICAQNDTNIVEIKETLHEAQYIISDITQINLLTGIALGVALEKNIEVIILKKETVIENNSEIQNILSMIESLNGRLIVYKDYSEIVEILEKKIKSIY